MSMQRGQEMDPAMRAERMAARSGEHSAEHAAELAGLLGVDVDELTVMLENFRAEHADDRESLRAELSELDPAERREAMQDMRVERRAALAEALGVDADALSEIHEQAGQAGHGPQDARMGPRTGQRMGSHTRS